MTATEFLEAPAQSASDFLDAAPKEPTLPKVKLSPLERADLEAGQHVEEPPVIDVGELGAAARDKIKDLGSRFTPGNPAYDLLYSEDKLDAAQRLLQPAAAATGYALKRAGEATLGTVEDLLKGSAYDPQTGKYQTAILPANLINPRYFETPSYWMGTPSPYAKEAARVLKPGGVAATAYGTAAGLVESAPQMLAASALGPEAGPAVWGLSPEGFDPGTAATMYALPGVSEASGALAENLASKAGVSSDTAKAIVNHAVRATAATGMIAGDSIRKLMELPEDQRKKAIPDLVGNALAMWAMSLPGDRKQMLSQLDREDAQRVDGALREHAEDFALRVGLPEHAQRFAPFGVPEPGGAGETLGAGQPFPDRLRALPITEEESAKQAKASGLLSKPPRATVPEGPTEPPAETPATTPTAAQELTSFDDFVADLRKRGNANMTIAQVQALYPQVFQGGRNREGARSLIEAAFGRRDPWKEVRRLRALESSPEAKQWTQEQGEANKLAIIKASIRAGIDPGQVSVTVNKDPAVPGFGYVQVDLHHPELGNVFSSNPDTLRSLGFKIPDTKELLQLPSGKHSLTDVLTLLGAPKEPGEGELEYGQGGELPGYTEPGQRPTPTPAPKPAAPPVEPPKEEAQTSPSVLQFPPREINAGQIVARPDLMQFRAGHNETGETREDALKGSWDELKGGMLLLWEPKNPAEYGLTGDQRYIVANGHHRFTFGQRNKVPAYSAQVLREADGYSAQDVRRIAAEANIADGKGTIYDQVRFLRNIEGPRGANDEVGARDRIGGKGRQAAAIAFDASDDLYTAFINERVSPAAAEAIATAAPKNPAAQLVGLKFAERVQDPQSLAALVKRAMNEKGGGQTLDLFGQDDSALKKMEEEESKAEKFRKDLREDINSMRSAKRADRAAKFGIDVKDPAAVQKKIAELEAEYQRWQNWWLHPDLAAKVRGKAEEAAPAPAAESPMPKRPAINAVGKAFSRLVDQLGRGDLGSILSDWNGSELSEDGETIRVADMRGGGGNYTHTKNQFFDWLYSPEADKVSQSPEWKSLIQRARRIASVEPETPSRPGPGSPPAAPQPPAPAPSPEGAGGTPAEAPKASGHFDDDAAAKARDLLKKKKPAQPPPSVSERLQGVRSGLVRRPRAEVERLQASAEEGAELFPGEKPVEDPLFDQATLNAVTTVGGNVLEQGSDVDFSSWFNRMTEELGPEFKHYFRRAYNQLRDVDSVDPNLKARMTPREEVELYNDEGQKVGKGSKHRPGLVVRDEHLMPPAEEIVTPNRWIGPEGDTLDWTQSRAVNLAMRARSLGRQAILIADGPGVGKSGIGAAIAHLLTFPPKVSLDNAMAEVWKNAAPEFKAKLLFGPERGGAVPKYSERPGQLQAAVEDFNPSNAQLDLAAKADWAGLRPELKQKIYRKYGYNPRQIEEDNVNAGSTERKRVLVVGTSKEHIETSFKPDFEKFGIPLDNIDFITYSLLSNPGAEHSPSRKLFDKVMGTDYGGAIFDEAHALKNAGSNREHNSRKIKAAFRALMTATPMDNTVNAIYFLSEITGKTRFQIMDQLGLQRVVKVVGGEEREFVVQKPGVSNDDVREQLIRLRSQAIADGAMVRREFPWWGQVIGREENVPLHEAARTRWEFATTRQRMSWLEPTPAEVEYPGGGEIPRAPMFDNPALQAASEKPAPGVRGPNPRLAWDELTDAERQKVMDRAFSAEEKKQGYVRMAKPGPYRLDPLDEVEAEEQQRIFDMWQREIDKSRNPMTRKNLSGQRAQELKRWLETHKAKRVLPIIFDELRAGRNVVLYSNTVNPHRVKGLGDGVWKDFQSTWPEFPGALGMISDALKKQNVRFAQIFGSSKDIKTQGIREFYSNRVRVALVTPESGGAGLNLDDVVGRYPRTVIVLDIPWKGDAFEQLMYRISRRNTASESKAHIVMVPNGISDMAIRQKMNQKLAILRGIQAGEDTDLQTFIEDLNNPEDRKETLNPRGDADQAATPMPRMNWEEVKTKSGRSRWKALATPEFFKWWNENGQEKNPLGIRLRKDAYYGPSYVWADAKPEHEAPEDRAAESSDDENLQASSMGGYAEPARYTGLPYDSLAEAIQAREGMIAEGQDVQANFDRLAELKAERDRRQAQDERSNNLLLDNARWNELNQLMEENPDSPNYPQWQDERAAISEDTARQVESNDPQPVQAATAAPGTVPNNVAAHSLMAPPKSMDEIMRMMKEGLGIPVRYKSWLGGGFFDPFLRYIRIKRVADHGGKVHEAGHALDAVFKFRDMPALDAELMHLGDNSRPGSRSSWVPGRSADYRRAEGVAEFVRYWVFEPQTASHLAPKMEQAWNSILDSNPQLAYMRQVRDDVQTYLRSDPQMRLRSKIITTGDPNQEHVSIGKVIEDTLDDMHVLRVVSDDAFRNNGGRLDPTRDPHLLYSLLRGNYGRADTFVRLGRINALTGEVELGKSLFDAIRPVLPDIANFKDYLIARQAQEMHNKGIESGFEKDEIRATLMRHGNKPEFQRAWAAVQEWQDSVLRYAVDGGYLSPGDYMAMKRVWQSYVPMRRFYEPGIGEEQVLQAGLGRQLARIGKPGSLRVRKGSERPVFDPIASMVENAFYLTYATEKNRALTAVADLVNIPNMGEWIGPVGAPKEKVVFGINRVRQQLEDMGVDTSGVPDDTLLNFWRESRRDPLPQNVIRVRRQGKNEYYQLNPDLYRAINASDSFSVGPVLKWVGAPTQLLRSGVVLDPSFALRHLVRYTINSAVISKFTHVPFEAALRGAYTMLAPNIADLLGFHDHADMLRQVEAEWRAAGGQVHTEGIFYDRDKLKDFVKNELTKEQNYRDRGLYLMGSPLRALRMITQVADEAVRIGEYQKAVQTLERRGMSKLDAHLLAAHEARDLMDFQMGGAKLKLLKYLTAFWNVGLQGNYRFFRSFTDARDPHAWAKTLLKGFGWITMAKMLEQWLNWKDDDYWSQPRWQRMMFYHIPLARDKTGHRQFALVPVPFEAGLIFASMPGALMDFIHTRDKGAGTAFAENFASRLVGNPVPQPVMAALEVIPELGYDYFQHRPILPSGAERLPYWARWTDASSATAKRLGKALNVSPAKIEHLMRGTTGGLGTAAVHDGLDPLLNLSLGDKPPPIRLKPWHSLVSAEPGARSQILQDFYDKLQVLRDEQTSRKKLHTRTPGMNIRDLAGMEAAEKTIAKLRNSLKGAYDDPRRERVALQIQDIARKWVRDPQGRYKQFLNKPQ